MAERFKAAVLFAECCAKTVDTKGPGIRIINMITLKCDFFMSFYTYILKSETSAGYYFGHCKDLQKRIANHNAGKVRSTKHNRPWHLHYFEKFETKSDAYKRELFFKSLDGRRWLKSNNII